MPYLSLRLGRFEVFAQRDNFAPTFGVSRTFPGEFLIDLPGNIGLALVNHSRVRAAQAARQRERDR